MHKNISSTILHSLIFAMGGAPTIAILIIHAQTQDPAIVFSAFVGLSVILACILVPVILIQNAYLWFKRKDEKLEEKIKPVGQFYMVLNVLCLIYWLSYQFMH